MTKLPPARSGRSGVRTAAVVAALLSLGALAGCGSGPSGAAGGSTVPSSSAPPSPSSSTSPAAPSSSTGSGATTGSAGPRVCTTADLSVRLRHPAGGAAAGSVYLLLSFTNSGGATCTMSGHPGVSFVGHDNGTQLGTSADRYGAVRTVTLSPGDSTSAVLEVAQAGNYPAGRCAPTTSDGLRVYPPDNRASTYVAFRTRACGGELGRGSSQLQVSAVGQPG